jgi:hypothetical protein
VRTGAGIFPCALIWMKLRENAGEVFNDGDMTEKM